MAQIESLIKQNRAELNRYVEMRQAIEACHRVDEVKEIRDKVRALEVYYAQAANHEEEKKCAQIRIRAERRHGQLTKEMKKNGDLSAHGGDRKSSGRNGHLKIKDLSVSHKRCEKWEALAELPDEEFEKRLHKPGYVSTQGVLRGDRPVREFKIHGQALWLWGALSDLEKKGILSRSPDFLWEQMTAPMREQTKRLLPKVIKWLSDFAGRVK